MTTNFELRAHLSEWMDEPCSYEDFRACLRDIVRVNRMLLGYRPTLQWLDSVVKAQRGPLHVVDVGCGAGDMLREIERWASRKGIDVQLTGIDLNPYAARAAREMTKASSRIRWVTGDAFSYSADAEIDIVISSLFTHHLADEEIARFLAWSEEVARVGWFINDLHRERVPYYGFKLMARAMRFHRFVQNDGPVSIRRAFREVDWQGYLAQAGIDAAAAQIQSFRPARLCVARVKS